MSTKSWTERGKGKCPNCSTAYNNRYKPVKCSCGFPLGGSYEPKSKKQKVSAPVAVMVTGDLYSVRTSNRGDRCLVMKDKGLWICFHEKCKELRATFSISNKLQEFACDHVKLTCQATPPEIVCSSTEDMIESYAASPSIREQLRACQQETAILVAQVSSNIFVVYGPPTASNPVGYCHISVVTDDKGAATRLVCCGKGCKGQATKSKHAVVKSMCIHLHVLCCFNRHVMPEPPQLSSSATTTCSPSATSSTAPEPSTTVEPPSQARTNTILQASTRSIPYHIDPQILQEVTRRDANSYLGQSGGWPDTYVPEEKNCSLCFGSLSQPKGHPGQSGNSYLITQCNAFKKVVIKVKDCSNCGAMFQVFPFDIGLFNICDKILLSIDILLELREHFKKGHPLKNSIESIMNVLLMKNKETCIGHQEILYLKDLIYHGFYCFEALTVRDMDSVICGICGVCPEVCLGDGNEKNCCSNSQVKYVDRQEGMASLDDFLGKIKMRLVERSVYTRNLQLFEASPAEIPPIIAPSIAGSTVVNTENMKKSVYLSKKDDPSELGDPAMLHKLIIEQEVDMENLQNDQVERIKKICKDCKIHTGAKSKELLIGELQSLYASMVIGLSPCHTFSKLPGKTGGFYHLVCRHGCTVASKFLTLTESVRDAADLYLSLKFQPIVFINDTPCGFVRHMQCRDIAKARQLWGEREGCFEKPKTDCKPRENHDVPEVVPLEYRENATLPSKSGESTLDSLSHPVANTSNRYVLGDRFHASTNPHKSPLCEYHNLNLCLQANALKTSIQESQNNRKNKRRLRSSCLQTFEHHFFFNYLMDFYQNEEIITEQKRNLSKSGLSFTRDNLLRFAIHME